MKYMARMIVLFLLSIVLVACQDKEPAKTEEPTDVTEQEEKADEELDKKEDEKEQVVDGDIESGKGGFLWRVDNGDTTIYLQGTVHLGTEDFYPFHEKIEQAYEEADIVVPEVDIADSELMEDMELMMMSGMYTDGTTIEDHVSEEIYAKLEEVFAEYNFPIEIAASFKPWMLDTLIMQLVAEELDYMHGVDMYFLERAKEDHKEIIELETAAEQLEVLSGQSDEFQERQLEETLDGIDGFGEMMKELFVVYLNGDEEELLDLLFPEEEEMDEEYEEYMVALNDDRNVNMAKKIEGFLEDGEGKTYFVIVGTAHLVLDPHIRTLLEEKGYNVDRIY